MSDNQKVSSLSPLFFCLTALKSPFFLLSLTDVHSIICVEYLCIKEVTCGWATIIVS